MRRHAFGTLPLLGAGVPALLLDYSMNQAAPENQTDALKQRLDARFRGPLMSYFLRRVRDRMEAEDLTQEVFVRLIGAGAFERLDNPDAFVFTIASNLLRDRGRRASRSPTRTLGLFEDDAIEKVAREFMEDRGPERVLLGKEAVGEVLKGLNALGERTRNIFLLFRLENMKQRDIAALYGISQSTVEKHVMKAVLYLAGFREDGQ